MTRQKPSFVLGYWRPWKDNSNVIDSYLDYRKDVTLAKYGADIVGKYISQSSKDQISAIKKLNNTFQSGISLISDQLGLVSNQINVVSNKLNKVNDSLLFLNRNMDILIEQQKLNNLLLENIGELLRVPDSEKERQLCIEKGLKHFVNASENLELYEDSLKYLLKSEEFADDDYFVLHRIGCIYLYAENFINPEKALKYFTRAAKYASVESNPKAIRLANILANNSRSPNSTSTSDLKIIKRFAAESFDKAAFSAYVIGNISLAIENAKKALECYPSAEYYFNLSKYQIRHGDISDGIINLNSAIEKNPTLHYAISQLCDLDLAGENKVHDLLEKLNNHTDEQINSLVFTFNKIEDDSSSNIKEINESKHLPYHLKLYKIIEFEETFKKAQNINSEIEKFIDSVQSYSDDNQIKTIVEELRKIKILEFSNDKIKKFENIKADDELRKILKENDDLNRLIEENFNLLNKNKSKIAVYEFQTIHDKLIETRKFDIERKYKSLTEINDYINDLIEMNELIIRIETILNKTVFKKPETYRSQLDNILLLPSPKRLSLYRQLLKEINEEKESNNKSNNNVRVENQQKAAVNENKKCFIATAAIGDEDHYIVNDFRKFRDTKLNNSPFGKVFIKFYYVTAPPFAFIVKNNNFIRKATAKYFIKPLHNIITKHIN